MKFYFFLTVFLLFSGIVAAQPTRISREISNDVEVIADLEYARYGDRVLKLDLYLPKERPNDLLPTIVVIRGGGWRSGDKEGFGPMASALAERGLATVSIEYRASGEAHFPAAVHDTKAAVRWIRSNATKYQLDSNAIGAIGGSAGAHLALYLGVTSHLPELEGEGGASSYSSEISAIVGFASPTDFNERRLEAAQAFLGVSRQENDQLWKYASPITHVTEAAPPILLIHSEADGLISFDQSLVLARKYGEVGVAVELFLFPEAPHDFWNYVEWFSSSIDRAAEFFLRSLSS